MLAIRNLSLQFLNSILSHPLNRRMRQKPVDLGFAHLLGMVFVVVKNELSVPMHTRLLSPFTVESCPDIPAHLVREFGFLGGKKFYSVVAQENPHLNDSELREVEKWLKYLN